MTPEALVLGSVMGGIAHALNLAFGMFWEILWALILGFALSATVQAVVSKSEMARRQAERGLVGSMEGHAEMEMSVTEGPILSRITSPKGFTAISHYFAMDWHAIWKDIVGGLLIAGALAAWVPERFWHEFFLISHPTVAKFWGPVIGPVVSIVSFVCSIGNVPLAAVLWNGGVNVRGGGSVTFCD